MKLPGPTRHHSPVRHGRRRGECNTVSDVPACHPARGKVPEPDQENQALFISVRSSGVIEKPDLSPITRSGAGQPFLAQRVFDSGDVAGFKPGLAGPSARHMRRAPQRPMPTSESASCTMFGSALRPHS